MSYNQFGKDLLKLINTDREDIESESFFIKYNIDSKETLINLIDHACNESTLIDDYYISLNSSIENALLQNGYNDLLEFINFLFEINNEC